MYIYTPFNNVFRIGYVYRLVRGRGTKHSRSRSAVSWDMNTKWTHEVPNFKRFYGKRISITVVRANFFCINVSIQSKYLTPVT